uniref:Uncharacterized protein n=1 Tax=Anguilla anguilla TaxID=7936 RepID=A0A0E9XCS5_ANGAN
MMLVGSLGLVMDDQEDDSLLHPKLTLVIDLEAVRLGEVTLDVDW